MSPCQAFGAIAVLFTLLSSAQAQNCQRSTLAKLAAVDLLQSERDQLCAAIGIVGGSSEKSFTARDYSNIATAGRQLKGQGYQSPTVYLELVGISGIRPSSEVELLAKAYASSRGCLTPDLVLRDMTNAIRSGSRGEAMKMLRSWDRSIFITYLAMVGNYNSCKFG